MSLWANRPITGSPSSELHSVFVFRSYMILLERYSIPEVPKVVASPSILAEYTIPVPQSVHHMSEIGSSPTTSLTISWAFTMLNGYARLSPLIVTPNTRSFAFR